MAELVGRRDECDALDRLVADVLAGTSRVLVLRGDPGVGKTALLNYVSDRVASEAGRGEGWGLVSAMGVESETDLAYSGLHQLCAPLLDHFDELPPPQGDALATVFGLSAGPAPDRFLVGLATLALVAQAAERHPLACIIDDAQWLDQASAQIIGFVARRLLAERVALVCAARTGIEEGVLAGLPTLPIGGLRDSDARPLLLGHVHGPLDSAIVDQIIAESHGNPLALLELPRTWRTAGLAGGYGLPGSQPVAGKIERSYARRLELLPADTRLLVLTAAAEPLGDPELLRRAADALGIDMTAMAPAADAGLVQVRGRVEFAHPLVRSAAYRNADAGDRQRVHGALAQATDAQTDPDRRAWHRARAAAEPDEDVAGELERSADRARARAGLAAAAAFLTRATELTPLPAARTRRALAAASANVQAGAFDIARSLVAIARAGPVDELQRAQIDLISAQMAFASSRGNEATLLLLAAAQRLQPLDLQLTRQSYLDAFSAAQFAARLDDGVGVAEVARAARSAPRRPDAEPTAGDLLLDAFVAFTEDYASAVAVGRSALARLRSDTNPAGERLRWLWQGCVLALELWDEDSAYLLSERHLQIARKTGALSELPLALGSHTPILVFRGEIAAAVSLAEEARSVLEAAGIAEAPYGALILAAWQGETRKARDLIEVTTREATSRGEGIGVAICQYAHAVLCNGLGEYDEALVAARGACEDPHEMVAHNWGLAELIESASRTGMLDLAADAVQRQARKARACRTDWALGIEARSRALLSCGDTAERQFREAIEHLSRARVRAELARAHLLYGEWLRRANRRADARGELTLAYEMFTAMRMEGFAERTRRELLATGATVRKRTVESSDQLTAQETLIARLAGDGLSNTEIGAHLFISTRTVEWHLRKVFSKLGVSSRRQLQRALRLGPGQGLQVAGPRRRQGPPLVRHAARTGTVELADLKNGARDGHDPPPPGDDRDARPVPRRARVRARDHRLAVPGKDAGQDRQGHRSPELPDGAVMNPAGNLSYDVFVNDPPPQDGFLPNGEPKRFSPQASTLIYGSEDAVLTDPGLTADQAGALGDWVAGKDRNLTDIFVTHGHGDHWFAAGLLAERFGARVVASAGTITQMHASVAARPVLWDKLYPGIPPSPVTAVTVPDNRFTLQGHDLVIVEVGHTDSDDTTVLHVPDLGLVVAGDAIYNGVHMYLGQSAVGGFGPWRDAIAKVEALGPRHIVTGHLDRRLDDDASRTIAQTRQYLDDAEELLQTENSDVGFFNAKIERYPDYLGRMILWVSARALYGVRGHPAEDAGRVILASWL